MYTHVVSVSACYSTDVVDYSGLSAAVTLSATASEDCVSIRVVDDSVLEETESLMVSLSLTGELTSVLLTIPFATLHITNDDGEGKCTDYMQVHAYYWASEVSPPVENVIYMYFFSMFSAHANIKLVYLMCKGYKHNVA